MTNEDRLSLPTNESLIKRASETGIKGDWDYIFNRDESTSSEKGNNPLLSSPPSDWDNQGLSGGGIGGIDLLFSEWSSDRDSVDAEHLELLKEFIKDIYGENATLEDLSSLEEELSIEAVEDTFSQWLHNDENITEKLIEIREKLLDELNKISVRIDSSDNSKIITPDTTEKTDVPVNLDSTELKSNPEIAQENNTAAESEEKSPIEMSKQPEVPDAYQYFDLKMDLNAAADLKDQEAQEDCVQLFVDWKNGELESLFVGFTDGNLEAIAAKNILGEKLVVPLDAVMAILGLKKDDSISGKEGLKLKKGDEEISINYNLTQRKIEDIFHRIRIDDVPLSKSVKVNKVERFRVDQKFVMVNT